MQTVQLGEFKSRFSEMIDSVRAGETIVLTDGYSHEKVAALIPYKHLSANKPRRLGTLAGIASISFAEDFAMTDNEFLGA